MRCRVRSWSGVGKVYEDCDSDFKEGNANFNDGLSQRVDGGYFNDWNNDQRYLSLSIWMSQESDVSRMIPSSHSLARLARL